MRIDGTYIMSLDLPGGARQAELEISMRGGAITGFMTNPYEPTRRHSLYDGCLSGESLSFKTTVGRVEYSFSGIVRDSSLLLTLTTGETIPLDPGKRIGGKTGRVEGEYLVDVYSPGGAKENHLVIEQTGSSLSGEMYGLVTEESLAQMAKMMPGGGPGGPGAAPPGAPPPGAPPAGMGARPAPKIGDKMDVNPIIAGSASGSSLELETKTAQGSLFRFVGYVEGDEIRLTMYVTDVTEGIVAKRV